MHEMGMCQAVLDAVERRAVGRPVAAIGVRVGERLAVVPDVFQQGFQMLAQGGVADGATTQVEFVPEDELILTWVRYREPAEAGAAASATARSEPEGG